MDNFQARFTICYKLSLQTIIVELE